MSYRTEGHVTAARPLASGLPRASPFAVRRRPVHFVRDVCNDRTPCPAPHDREPCIDVIHDVEDGIPSDRPRKCIVFADVREQIENGPAVPRSSLEGTRELIPNPLRLTLRHDL